MTTYNAWKHTKTGRNTWWTGSEQKLCILWQNSNWNIAEGQTYRPSFAGYFIIQLLLFSLHVSEERIFAQVFIVSRALEIHIFRHLGFSPNHRLAQKFKPVTADPTRNFTGSTNKMATSSQLVPFLTNHLTRIIMLTRTLFPRHIFVNKFHGSFRWSSSNCFFFPGQGAQSVGMCKHLQTQRKVLQLFEDASKILGYDLLNLCLNGPVEELNKTVNCQPAIVVASLAVLQDAKVKGTKVNFSRQNSDQWELQWKSEISHKTVYNN